MVTRTGGHHSQNCLRTMELPTTSFELTSIAAATSLHARQDSHCQLNTVYDPFTADIKSSMIKWTTDIVAVR